MHGLYCGTLMFADDLVLTAVSHSDLQVFWILQLPMHAYIIGIILLMLLSLLYWFLVSLLALVLHFMCSVISLWILGLSLSMMT